MTEQSPHPLQRLADASRATGIRRPREGRWVAGVAAGLGARYGIDPVIVRVGIILASVLGGVGLTLYLFGWALLPADDGHVAVDRGFREGDAASIVLCVIALLSLIGPGASGNEGISISLWGLLVVALGVWIIARGARRIGAAPEPSTWQAPTPDGTPGAPTATTPRPFVRASSHPPGSTHPPAPPAAWPTAPSTPSTPPTSTADRATATPAPRRRDRRVGLLVTLVVLGASIVAYLATAWSMAALQAAGDPHVFGLIAILAVCGLALVGVGIAGHRAPLVTITAWVLGALLAASTLPGTVVDQLSVQSQDPPQRWAPTSTQGLRPSYEVGVGDGTLDLSGLPASAAREREDLSLDAGIGDLTLIVPQGYGTRVLVEAGIGEVVTVRDGHRSVVSTGLGNDPDPLTFGQGPAILTVRADLGIGQFTVIEKGTP